MSILRFSISQMQWQLLKLLNTLCSCKHAADMLQVKHAAYVMHVLSKKYVNINVNSSFLNQTNAMASTKIPKHPVQGVQSWQGHADMENVIFFTPSQF